MAQGNFPACLAFTLAQEGGFSDDPYDPGGATNHGITLVTMRGYVHDPAATVADLRAIPPGMVASLYETGYWAPASAEELACGLDLMVFDMAVNAGPARSIMLLQQAAGAPQDGIIGPRTLAAIAGKNTLALICALASAQYWYYRGLSTWNYFGAGWAARVKAREDTATAMAGRPAAPSIPAPAPATVETAGA